MYQYTPAAMLLIAGLAAQAHAQPSDGTTETPQIIEDGEDVRFDFHAQTTYYDGADFDDASGVLEAWRSGFGVGASIDADEGVFNLGLDAEYTGYDFIPASGGGGGPGPARGDGGGGGGGAMGTFDDVTILTLSGSYTGQLDNGDHWFVGAAVSSAREDGAAFDDSIAGTVFGGYRHKVSDTFHVGFGVAVKSRLEDDVLIVPLPQVHYDMGGGWALDNQRAGLKLMYAASDTLSVGVTAEYESRTFRLADTNAISEGAATESRVPVAFQIEYKQSEAFKFHARVGASLSSDLEFFDAAGNTVSQRDFDSSVFFGFGGTIFF